jgi:hypothetical protein
MRSRGPSCVLSDGGGVGSAANLARFAGFSSTWSMYLEDSVTETTVVKPKKQVRLAFSA